MYIFRGKSMISRLKVGGVHLWRCIYYRHKGLIVVAVLVGRGDVWLVCLADTCHGKLPQTFIIRNSHANRNQK